MTALARELMQQLQAQRPQTRQDMTMSKAIPEPGTWTGNRIYGVLFDGVLP